MGQWCVVWKKVEGVDGELFHELRLKILRLI